MAGFPLRPLLQVGHYPGSDRPSSFLKTDYENFVVWMLLFIYGFYGDVVSTLLSHHFLTIANYGLKSGSPSLTS